MLHSADLLQGASRSANMRLREVDMVNAEAAFGFIGYYVYGVLRRIPVQFFRVNNGTFAWIDGGRVEDRLMVEVTADMGATVIGNFASLMKSYNTESAQVVACARLWNECIHHEAGVLLLFQIMHEMRMQGAGLSEAMESVIRNISDIRKSEQEAVEELMELMTTTDFFQTPDQMFESSTLLSTQTSLA